MSVMPTSLTAGGDPKVAGSAATRNGPCGPRRWSIPTEAGGLAGVPRAVIGEVDPARLIQAARVRPAKRADSNCVVNLRPLKRGLTDVLSRVDEQVGVVRVRRNCAVPSLPGGSPKS